MFCVILQKLSYRKNEAEKNCCVCVDPNKRLLSGATSFDLHRWRISSNFNTQLITLRWEFSDAIVSDYRWGGDHWVNGRDLGVSGQNSEGGGSVAEVWGVASDTCTRSCTEFVAHGKSRGQFIITWGWHGQHLWVKIDPVQWKHTRLMYTTINSGVSLHLLKSNWIDF